ncbi:glycoside hydrolase [Panaeolus papilionaceus]|nr:glycoside hydrolase [Panaeolus papilionaceus]
MHPNALLSYLTAVISISSAAFIPIQRVRIENAIPIPHERRVWNYDYGRTRLPALLPSLTIIQNIPTNVPSTSPVPSSSAVPVESSAPVSIESTSASPSVSATQASVPSSAPATQATISNNSGKYVVAHHMVGNTYPYTLKDWAEDVTLATAAGIDGFALNTGRDVWEPERIADAYEAAKLSGTGFKLFLSLDMTSLPCGSAQDAQNLRDLVKKYIDHPNQMQYDNKAVVSTFAGDTCTFGQGSTPDAWRSQFTQHSDLNGKIYFVPSFFVDPAKFGEFSGVMHGDFNWNSGWPIQVTTGFAQQAAAQASANEKSGITLRVVTGATSAAAHLEKGLQDALINTLSEQGLALSKFIGSTDSDDQHINGLSALSNNAERTGAAKQLYMGSVSPWFFTHYGPDTFNKNFVYLSDQHLYSKRWESIIDARDNFDIIQVLSWNDYGESHYIGPIKGDQPKSQAWTDGMDHTGWLELTGYYAAAFKTGQFPTVDKDKLFMWSRPHPAKASAPDPVPQPTNYELFEDTVWAVVMATAPSTVNLATSATNTKSFEVPAGVSKLAMPISAGGIMKGNIVRDGKVVLELNPTQFQFQGSPKTYNYNAFVAHASA